MFAAVGGGGARGVLPHLAGGRAAHVWGDFAHPIQRRAALQV